MSIKLVHPYGEYVASFDVEAQDFDGASMDDRWRHLLNGEPWTIQINQRVLCTLPLGFQLCEEDRDNAIELIVTQIHKGPGSGGALIKAITVDGYDEFSGSVLWFWPMDRE